MVFDRDMGSLRDLSQDIWSQVVGKANATILSTISNPDCDAYLLSESSLFVYADRLVMITCGETSLITAVDEIFKHTDLNRLRLLVFERKNEIQPDQQPSDFEADVAFLSELVPGKAVRFGSVDGNFVHCYYYSRPDEVPSGDMTLEILMHDLDPGAEQRFVAANRQNLYDRTGIHQLFPDFQTDDYFFDPMGYSLNSIGESGYYTIHVTPQSHCSYASFETNVDLRDNMEETIRKVIAIFKPRSFSVLVFESDATAAFQLRDYVLDHEETLGMAGYRVRFYDFLEPSNKPAKA